MAKSSFDSPSIDPSSGFCTKTKIYHSLRPETPLPSDTANVNITDYAFSLLRTSLSAGTTASTAGLIDAATGMRIPYPELIRRTETLAVYLQTRVGLSKGDSAFLLSPNSVLVPIIYFALFSLGVVISPSNPTSTESEISRQIALSKSVIAFAISDTAYKIPNLRHGTIITDSSDFESMMTARLTLPISRVEVSINDPATILYSSGTTGMMKGVMLTYRNWTSIIAGAQLVRTVRVDSPIVSFCAVPYFHVYGFISCVKAVALGETLVTMERFDFRVMMKAIEEFRVTHVAVAPPVIVKMVKDDSLMNGCDLSSLEVVACGGAPLARTAIQSFNKLLPSVQLAQAYGLTESTGGIARPMGPNESKVLGASGRLVSNCRAKIVDPDSGICLPPMKAGELLVRGPLIMKGYIGDKEATAVVLDSDGWLRTGDLCYFDNEGFMFYVERIKELIKYKGYQIAPAELEHMLLSHPDILDSAVIPYPDVEAGEVPMAFVVRRHGSTITESQIVQFIAKQVAPYKKIRRVSFVTTIPKNAPGKVLRKDLIKFALANTTSKL